MRVETAIYGEVKGGHALRSASGDHDFANSIASRLDLPSNPPPGISWSSYLAGFALDGRYVLSRTFLDTTAARGGMVLVQALIMPVQDLAEFGNLRALLLRMASASGNVDSPIGFDITDDGDLPSPAVDLVSAANALATKGTGPVVKMGTEGFEELLASLWPNLWPAARASFGFRLSFGPQDLVENPVPALVCTPSALAARWSGCRIISEVEGTAVRSQSAAIFAGRGDRAQLMIFGRNIGAELRNLSELPMLERALALSGLGVGFDDLLAAVRLVQTLSPSPTAGSAAKMELLDRLANDIAGATPEQIAALRNVAFTGFPSASGLWQEIEKWLMVQRLPAERDSVMIQIVVAAHDAAAAVEPWRSAVAKGFRAGARSPGSDMFQAFWRWIGKRPEMLDAVFSLLPVDRDVEMRLVAETPRKIEKAQPAMRRLALERGWLEMHGAVLSATETVRDAIRLQIAVDTDPNGARGIMAALRRATPAEIVSCAIEFRDTRLTAVAGDAVATDKSLFAGATCANIGEQLVWDAALHQTPNSWRALSNPQRARDTVLDALLDGGEVHRPLVETIARTPLADLSDYSRREQLWEVEPAGSMFLDATAGGWLRRTVDGEVYPLDERLKTRILADSNLEQTMVGLINNLAAALRIVSALDAFEEDRFLRWMRAPLAADATIDVSTAETLGRLVLERNWRHVLDEIVSRYRAGRRDLKQTLRICTPMLRHFTRWQLDLSSPSADEKWESFITIAANLYPNGPDQDGLWSRAGGRDADLPKYGTGQSAWRTAAGYIRNGRGPTASRLLEEMQRDYHSNQDLRFLKRDSDITGRSW